MNLSLPQIREQTRGTECEHRSGGGCIEVSRRTGWDVSVSIDWCDHCYNSGRPDARIQTLVERIVSSHSRREVRHKLDREVLEALKTKHGLDISTDEIAQAADRKELWRKVRPSWETAYQFVKTITASLTLGKIAEDRYEARLARCRSCPAVRKSGNGEFCGVCGCGDTKLARLDEKLKHPLLTCPMGRFT